MGGEVGGKVFNHSGKGGLTMLDRRPNHGESGSNHGGDEV